MKKFLKYGVVMAMAAFTLSSCNCFKKMAKNTDQISIVANPEVLTLVGNEIVTDVTVVFPEKYYNPKAIVRITPILVFDGGAIEGAPKYLQGERVKDNYPVISKHNGGVYTQRIAFPWDPRARKCVLELKVEGKCKEGDDFVLGGVIPVAEGVNALQENLSYADALIVMPDDFKRITHESESVNIMYLVNQSNVRRGELTKAQTKLFEDFIKENENKDRVTLGNIEAKGYASPEGPEGLNERLSKARSESGKNAISRELRKLKDLKYDVAAYGEDWEGFKELVEASNMKDKAMIIQVLNMYSSAAQRDAEIKNMSAVFEELKKNILPELRRTQMVATTDIQGKTDTELVAAINNREPLNLEETLFAATLFDDCAKKGEIYKAAAEKWNDARAWNNLGVSLGHQNKWAEAENAFQKATNLSSNPALANNLALSAMVRGDLKKAAEYLPTAGEHTKGLASIHGGKYAEASSNLEGYNKAVAEVLNGNLSAAKNALVGDNSAKADYLRGVIYAKEGNKTAAVAELKKANEKDPAIMDRAREDINLKEIVAEL